MNRGLIKKSPIFMITAVVLMLIFVVLFAVFSVDISFIEDSFDTVAVADTTSSTQKTTDISGLDLSSDDVDLIDVYGAVESGTIMYNNEVSGTAISTVSGLYSWLIGYSGDAYLTCDLTIDLSSDTSYVTSKLKQITSSQTFDGNGYTITFNVSAAISYTVTYAANYYSFLIDYCEGTIKNLSVEYVNTGSDSYEVRLINNGAAGTTDPGSAVGCVVGKASGATISNVNVVVSESLVIYNQRSMNTIDGVSASYYTSTSRSVGGIAGTLASCAVNNCTIDIQGSIYADSSSDTVNYIGNNYVGGVCGYSSGTTLISNCAVTLDTEALYGKPRNVSGASVYFGGVVGYSAASVSISNMMLGLATTIYKSANASPVVYAGYIIGSGTTSLSGAYVYMSESTYTTALQSSLSGLTTYQLYNYSAPTINVTDGDAEYFYDDDSIFDSFLVYSSDESKFITSITQTTDTSNWARFSSTSVDGYYYGTFSIADIIYYNSASEGSYNKIEYTVSSYVEILSGEKTVHLFDTAIFPSDLAASDAIVENLNSSADIELSFAEYGTGTKTYATTYPTETGTYYVLAEIYCYGVQIATTEFVVEFVDIEQKTTELSSLDLSSSSVSLIDVYGAVESGTVSSTYSTTSGDTAISTATELSSFLNGMASNYSTDYYLANNIYVDLSTWANATDYTAYSGTFDGNGYSIIYYCDSDITLDVGSYYYASLFIKNLTGTVKNLNIVYTTTSTSDITYIFNGTGTQYPSIWGGVAGAVVSAGTINNVSVTITENVTIDFTGCTKGAIAGGIAGNNFGTISNSTSYIYGTLCASNDDVGAVAGGISGRTNSGKFYNNAVVLSSGALEVQVASGLYGLIGTVVGDTPAAATAATVGNIIIDAPSDFYTASSTGTTYVGLIGSGYAILKGTGYTGTYISSDYNIYMLQQTTTNTDIKTTGISESYINLYNYSTPTSINVNGVSTVVDGDSGVFASFTIVSDDENLYVINQTNGTWDRFSGANFFYGYSGTFSIADIISGVTISYEFIGVDTAVVTPNKNDYDKTVDIYKIASRAVFTLSDMISDASVIASINEYCEFTVLYTGINGTDYDQSEYAPSIEGTYEVYCEVTYNGTTIVSETYSMEVNLRTGAKTTDLPSLDLSSSSVSLIDVYGAVESGTISSSYDASATTGGTPISSVSELYTYLAGDAKTTNGYLTQNIYVDLSSFTSSGYNDDLRSLGSSTNTSVVFDGAGYSIIFYASSNVSISDIITDTLTRTSFLIHNVYGTVQNLSVIYGTTSTSNVTYTIANTNSSTSANLQWGGITAYLTGTINNVYVEVSENVTIQVAKSTATSGVYAIGGIVGSSAGKVTNSTVNIQGTITTSTAAKQTYMGGINGEYSSGSSTNNCAVVMQEYAFVSNATTTSWIGAIVSNCTSTSSSSLGNIILDVPNSFYSSISATNYVGLISSGKSGTGTATPTVSALYLLQVNGLSSYGATITATTDLSSKTVTPSVALSEKSDTTNTDLVSITYSTSAVGDSFTIALTDEAIEAGYLLVGVSQTDTFNRFNGATIAYSYTGTFSVSDVKNGMSISVDVVAISTPTSSTDDYDKTVTDKITSEAEFNFNDVIESNDFKAVLDKYYTLSVQYSGTNAVPTTVGTYEVYCEISYNNITLVSETYTLEIIEDPAQKTTDLTSLDLSSDDVDLIDVYGAVESGTVSSDYTASGTPISTVSGLYSYLNSTQSQNAYLKNNIYVDLATYSTVCSASTVRTLTATLDGAGYSIIFYASESIEITESSSQTNISFLINSVEGTVKNLTVVYATTAVDDVTYTMYKNSTSKITFGGLTGVNSGTIDNVNVVIAEGVTIIAKSNGQTETGGIIGNNYGGAISNSTAEIYGSLGVTTTSSYASAIGGIIGRYAQSAASIDNCAVVLEENSLIVTASLSAFIGAVFGDVNSGAANKSISNIYLNVPNDDYYNSSATTTKSGLIASGYVGYSTSTTSSVSVTGKLALLNGTATTYGVTTTSSDLTIYDLSDYDISEISVTGGSVTYDSSNGIFGSFTVGLSSDSGDNIIMTAIEQTNGSWERFADITEYYTAYTGKFSLADIIYYNTSATSKTNLAYTITSVEINAAVSEGYDKYILTSNSADEAEFTVADDILASSTTDTVLENLNSRFVITYNGSETVPTTAGEYVVKCALIYNDVEMYSTTYKLVITNAAAITVGLESEQSAEQKYGSDVPKFKVYLVDGYLLTDDAFEDIEFTITYNADDSELTNGTNVGSYTITISDISDSNKSYSITISNTTTANLNIIAADIVYTTPTLELTYGEDIATILNDYNYISYSFTGSENSEDLTGTFTLTSGVAYPTTVNGSGDYNFTFELSDDYIGNYNGFEDNIIAVSVTINKADIVYTETPTLELTYGEDIATILNNYIIYSFSGSENSDVLKGEFSIISEGGGCLPNHSSGVGLIQLYIYIK
ncbi:MAG: hypothetical protein R3Y23_01470 [Bacillota bacterium]